jgi:hypothetical protein
MNIIKAKDFHPYGCESVLMPDRKESGAEEGRKPNLFGIKVVQFRGLAASLRNEMSRVARKVKCGRLNLLGARGTVGIRWKRRESIILQEPLMIG